VADEGLEELHAPLGSGRVSKRHEGFEAASSGFVSISPFQKRDVATYLLGTSIVAVHETVQDQPFNLEAGLWSLETHLDGE